MNRAGLSVRSCKLSRYPHPDGVNALVISCVATNGEPVDAPRPTGGLAETQRFLRPDAMMLMRFGAMLPGSVLRAAVRKLKQASLPRSPYPSAN
jgi:hypothetical protein